VLHEVGDQLQGAPVALWEREGDEICEMRGFERPATVITA
jgi:hypothetical protein